MRLYAYRGTGADVLTPGRAVHEWKRTLLPPVVPGPPPPPEVAEALDGLIAGIAAAFARCAGCLEPGPGHTTDCTVRPGKLMPHGTYAAARRHGRRGEGLCDACKAGGEAA